MKKILKMFAVVAVLLCVCISGTGCGGSEGAKSITKLTYNGETITWSSVKNAKNYKIQIGTSSYVVSQAEGTVSYPYDAAGENFDFSIEAVIKEGSDKNPTYSIQFQNIGQVEGLKIEHGKLKWDALDGAERYEIMYNGKLEPSSVGINEYVAAEGSFNYKVRGQKGTAESTDGNIPYYSVWSDAITGKVLAAPKQLTYDSETFRWDKVDGANSYVIKIGTEEFQTSNNSYAYAASDKNFNVSVQAVGDVNQKIYNSDFAEEKSYTYIAPIEGLTVTDGILKWNAAENAVRYKIKLNGIVNKEELTTNDYAALASGQSYRIQIMPIGKSDFYFSRWSNELTVNILRSPVVSYGDGVIKWNQVTGCSGYEVKIEKDGKRLDSTAVGNETFTYRYAFGDAGDYQVSIKATALGTGGIYESKFSTSFSVKRLATPSNQKVSNRPLEEAQVAVSFTPAVGASGHALLADGVEIASIKTGSTFNVDLSKMTSKTAESAVNFKIIARGSVTSQGAVLDSNVPLEFTVTKLAMPQHVAINGSQITWDSVAKTSKYILTLDGKRTEVTTTSFTLTDMAAGSHTAYVQAMGNGEDVITGSFSSGLTLKKLATPTNLVTKGGNLTWGAVQSATAYKVILGSERYDAQSAAFNLLGYAAYITEGAGTQISVYAIGNGSDVIDSDVSATKTVSKYTRPSAVKANGDNLVWNASSIDGVNANKYRLTIDEGKTGEKTVEVSGTSYAFFNFTAGEHTVSVAAIGDYVSTIDSPESDSFTFTKLAQVENIVKSGTKISWDAVAGAVGYEIKLSKDATWTSLNENFFEPKYTSTGDHEISIRAIGDASSVINSEIDSFRQQVKALTTPVKAEELTNINAFIVERSGSTVTITIKDYALAMGYCFIVDGVRHEGQNASFTYTMTTSGAEYNFQVQVLGNIFGEDGVFYLDSNPSTIVTITNA